MGFEITYGETLYRPKGLKAAAHIYTQALIPLMEKDKNIVGLVSTGSSGAILAAAILLLDLPRELSYIHVNKPNGGSSHAGAFSGYGNSSNGVYVFVDDFISSGASLKRCVDALAEYSKVKIKYVLVNYGTVDMKVPSFKGLKIIHAE